MYPQTILELDDDEGQKERGCEDPDSPCLHIEGSRPKLDENRSYDRRYSDVEIVDIARVLSADSLCPATRTEALVSDAREEESYCEEEAPDIRTFSVVIAITAQ
mgnify:CR=1 FL=1